MTKPEISRRVWMGLAIVCMVGLLIGAILSIRGQEKEWVGRRLEAADQALTEERLIEGILTSAKTPTPSLLSPYSQEPVLGFRAWRDTERGPGQDPFRDAEQQALLPLNIVTPNGHTYAIDTRKIKSQQFDPITWIHPRDAEFILGTTTLARTRDAPTQQPPAGPIHEHEITLREGDTISVLGTPSYDPTLGGDTIGGENVMIFRGKKADWLSQSQAPSQDTQPTRYAGLALMALSALTLIFLLARLIIGRLRAKRNPTTDSTH